MTEHYHERQPITPETKEWLGVEADLPIYGEDIPGFAHWVNLNGFYVDRETGRGHPGFDFAAYLTADGAVAVGLPTETPIRAVTDGKIIQGGSDGPSHAYFHEVVVEHAKAGSGMFSQYVHVVPVIPNGSEVQKGDVVGTLYKDSLEQEKPRLVHLHLGLIDGWGTHDTGWTGGLNERLQDPSLIDPSIYDITTSAQGFAPFDLAEVPGAERIELAHFNEVHVVSDGLSHVLRRGEGYIV